MTQPAYVRSCLHERGPEGVHSQGPTPTSLCPRATGQEAYPCGLSPLRPVFRPVLLGFCQACPLSLVTVLIDRLFQLQPNWWKVPCLVGPRILSLPFADDTALLTLSNTDLQLTLGRSAAMSGSFLRTVGQTQPYRWNQEDLRGAAAASLLLRLFSICSGCLPKGGQDISGWKPRDRPGTGRREGICLSSNPESPRSSHTGAEESSEACLHGDTYVRAIMMELTVL